VRRGVLEMAINKPQRIVLVLYCVLLTYCCVWIPWYVSNDQDHVNIGYGWLWNGPVDIAVPDLPRICLRIVAATALSAAVFFGAGW
jgi:hypothetical protein